MSAARLRTGPTLCLGLRTARRCRARGWSLTSPDPAGQPCAWHRAACPLEMETLPSLRCLLPGALAAHGRFSETVGGPLLVRMPSDPLLLSLAGMGQGKGAWAPASPGSCGLPNSSKPLLHPKPCFPRERRFEPGKQAGQAGAGFLGSAQALLP